jgi:probable HAF family extracellular repeat protein
MNRKPLFALLTICLISQIAIVDAYALGDSCTYTVNPSQQTISPYEGTVSMTVTAPSGCTWSVSSDADWIYQVDFIPAGDGTSGGSVILYAMQNYYNLDRVATITMQGLNQTITSKVTQSSCLLELSSYGASFFKAGGSGSTRIITSSLGYEAFACQWTAVSDSPWIVISPDTQSGWGTSSVNFRIQANRTSYPRTGSLTIGGFTYTINQSTDSGSGGMIIDLGTMGDVSASVSAITPDGRVVVGYTANENYDKTRAFLWSKATGMIDVGGFGGRLNQADAVSADGRVVVGRSMDDKGVYHFFRWTKETGMIDLGMLAGNLTSALYVSADGSVISGESYINDNENYSYESSFRWTAESGLKDLNSPGISGAVFRITGMSSDGSSIIGYLWFGDNIYHAARWTALTGLIDLGAFGGDESYCDAVSSDGGIIAGSSSIDSQKTHAFRWDQASGMRDMGFSDSLYSRVASISSDGSVMAGEKMTHTFSSGDSNMRAIVWSPSAEVIELGALGFSYSYIYGISGDGTSVFGWARDSNSIYNELYFDQKPYIWTSTDGMQSVDQWLAGSGLSSGEQNAWALSGISADGKTVAGLFSSFRIFLARVEKPCGAKPAKVSGSEAGFDSIKDAYDTAASNQTIKLRMSEFVEDITFDSNMSISLMGGYDCAYSESLGWTTINGTVMIKGGAITADSLIIK